MTAFMYNHNLKQFANTLFIERSYTKKSFLHFTVGDCENEYTLYLLKAGLEVLT